MQVPDTARGPTPGPSGVPRILPKVPKGFFQEEELFAPNNAPLTVTSFLQVFIPQITD